MMKYNIGLPCPICYRQVSFVADNWYDEFAYYDFDDWRHYLAPIYLVLYPCRHRIRELRITEWGGISWKPIIGKLDVKSIVDEGWNAFVDGKQGEDNPYFLRKDCQKYYEWNQGWTTAREIAWGLH